MSDESGYGQNGEYYQYTQYGAPQTPNPMGVHSSAPAPESRPKKSGARSFLEFLGVIALALALTLGLRAFIVEPYQVPSGSMEPTISIGDHILAEKFDLNVSYGDIVTFKDPMDESRTLIKRVIATEGQTIDLIDGYVYIDGERLEESYTHGKRTDPFSQTYDGVDISYPYTVPKGCIWVMGDNRTNSQDSRYFGPVSTESITGKGFFTYWPIESLGTLE